jgi:RNA polymerase sigma factor (sigma-70 family)
VADPKHGTSLTKLTSFRVGDDAASPRSDTPAHGIDDDRAAAVSRLFQQHNRTLVGFLFARLKNEQEAKEIAQEAYVKVLQLEQRPGAASFMRSYLFRVAENLALDRLRQRQSRSRLDQLDSADDLFAEPTAERAAIAGQELAELHCIVAELPHKCRQAFSLHRLEDHSLTEVARQMRLTERMVRKYVTRALVYIHLRRDGVSMTEAQGLIKS